MEYLKLVNFIDASEARLQLDGELMGLYAQLCGESHATDDRPAWLDPHSWGETSTFDIALKAVKTFASQLVDSDCRHFDDPETCAKWCQCLCWMLPAIRYAAGKARKEGREECVDGRP